MVSRRNLEFLWSWIFERDAPGGTLPESVAEGSQSKWAYDVVEPVTDVYIFAQAHNSLRIFIARLINVEKAVREQPTVQSMAAVTHPGCLHSRASRGILFIACRTPRSPSTSSAPAKMASKGEVR